MVLLPYAIVNQAFCTLCPWDSMLTPSNLQGRQFKRINEVENHPKFWTQETWQPPDVISINVLSL
jgi:hypothetical protein